MPLKKLLTVIRKNCLPCDEKTHYCAAVNSSYRVHTNLPTYASAGVALKSSIYFGSNGLKGAENAQEWTVSKVFVNASGSATGVVEMINTAAAASDAYGNVGTVLGNAYTADIAAGEKGAVATTAVAASTTPIETTENYPSTYKAHLSDLDGAKSDAYVLPSAAEFLASDANYSTAWTRDNVSTTTNGTKYNVDDASAATYAKDTSTSKYGAAANTVTTNAIYPAVSIDLSKALFINVDKSLTLIDSSIDAKMPAFTTKISGSTITATFASDPTEDGTYSLYYLESSGAYDAEDSTVIAYASVSLTNNAADVTVTSTSNNLYFMLVKNGASTSTGIQTVYCSTPKVSSSFTTPSSKNFKIAATDYTGSAFYAETILNLISAAKTNGDVIDGNNGGDDSKYTDDEIGITGIRKGTTVYAADSKTGKIITSDKAVDAGTYDVLGYIKKNGVSDGGTQFGTAGTATEPIVLGKLVVNPITLVLTGGISKTASFELADLDQFADTSYTVKNLPLTGTGIVTKDKGKVNLTSASVILVTNAGDKEEDTTATKTPGDKYTYISVTKGAIDNANYTVAATKITDMTVTVKAATIKSITVKKNPTTTNYATGTDFDPTGLVITVTLEGGQTEDIYYDGTAATASAFSFDPSTSLTTDDKEVTVTYTADNEDYVSTKTIPITVTDTKVELTKIDIPAKITVNVNGTVALPSVTYTPLKTTDSKVVTWTMPVTDSYDSTTGNHTIIYDAYFVDADGNAAFTFDNSTHNNTAEFTSMIANVNAVAVKGNATNLTGVPLKATSKVDENINDTCKVIVSKNNNSVEWMRLSGDGRYDTAAATLREAYVDEDTKPTSAVLVSGEAPWDALSASGYAGRHDMPILLTTPNALPDATAKLITDWGITDITIIGGTASVSDALQTELETKYSITTNRIAGDDRIDTAEQVFAEDDPDNYTAVVTYGYNYADALSISGASYANAFVTVLAKEDHTLSATSKSIIKNASQVLILGGDKAVSTTVDSYLDQQGVDYTRLKGNDRYETSAAIAQWYVEESGLDATYDKTVFASGENFPDALSAATLAGRNNSPVLLINGTTGAGFDLVAKSYVKASSEVSGLYIAGGDKVIPTDTSVKALTSNWSSSKQVTKWS